MIKRLRRRLILIFTFFTSLVLVLVVAFALWNALGQNTRTHQAAFEADNELVLAGVAAGNASPEWLGAMEQEKDLILAIDASGRHLSSPQTANDRAQLLQSVEALLADADRLQTGITMTGDNAEAEQREEAGNESVYGYTAIPLTLVVETIEGADGSRYWVRAALLGTVALDEAVIPELSDMSRVIVLKSTAEMQRQALWIALAYGGLLLLGVIILALVNRFLAGLVLKPTMEGIRQQTEFVAAASHELRNPLAVVRGSAHAGRKAKTAQDAVPYFDMVDAEAARMSRLVDDLLVLAGSESGRWHIEERTVELDALLIEAADTLAGLGKKKGVNLALQLPDEPLGKMRGDADRMMQVLRILVDNAVSYSHANGGVELRADKTRGGVTLRVADHGPGVDDEDKPRVFDRFYRGDKSRSDKAHFGLGLSVAKELVEMHGGALTLEDTPGGGATFTVRLPAQLLL